MFLNGFIFSLLFLATAFCVKAQVTYKDVAPIFNANCGSCHHQGGIQFPLTSYSNVVSYGYPISSSIQSNRMPPWPADPSYRNYVHERVLSNSDKAKIIDWISNGMKAGDTSLAPSAPVYNKTQLKGTPDVIYSLPKYTSTANTDDHYYCLNVSSGLTQDRYIKAFEFIPGNASLIHHAVITIDTLGTAVDDLSGQCTNFQGQVNIGDFAPGMGATLLPGVSPTKFGFRLKAGSKLSFQIHVPEGTAGQRDSSQLRVYFYPLGDTGIREMYFETILQNWNFQIPANTVKQVIQRYPGSTAGLQSDFSLFGAFPHSHNVCTSILNYAYKGADTIPLIRINKWDLHWQMQYTFKSLLKVTTGYRFYSSHVFDNTINNPNAPDPTKPVFAGLNTTDEMLFDSYLFATYRLGDENVNIDSLIQSDPLFKSTGLNQIPAKEPRLIVYPNPFSNFIEIENRKGNEIFALYNYTGQLVWNGLNIEQENFKELPSGMYILQINMSSGGQFLKLMKD